MNRTPHIRNARARTPRKEAGRKRLSAGFSTLEMLSVCLIVAILSALLMVVFSRTASASDQARCLGNLRALSTAIQLYVHDNSGVLPGPTAVSYDSRYTKNLISSRTHLTHFLAPYLLKTANNAEVRYLPEFVCPAAAKVMSASEFQGGPAKCYTQARTVLPGGTVSYPFGNREQTPELPPLRMQQIREPGRTIGLCDRATVVVDNPAAFRPVHGTVRNFLFMDGHAEAIALRRIRDGIEITD